MFITDQKLTDLLWEARQEGIKECKADLAAVFNWPVESSWQGMIDHVKVLDEIFKKDNEDVR